MQLPFRTKTAEPEAPRDVQLSDDERRAKLTPEQYHILREQGTERPFTGKYVDEHADGVYHCAACGAELLRSTDSVDSASACPSSDQPAIQEAGGRREDNSHFMRRTEVVCRRCGGHL